MDKTYKDKLIEKQKQRIKELIEENTGFVGQTIRNRRLKQEQEKLIQRELKRIEVRTMRLENARSSLNGIETNFTSISKNVQLIAGIMKAQVATLEETNKSLTVSKQAEQSANIQQRADRFKQIQKTNEIEKGTGEEKSLFDKVFDLLDRLGGSRRQPPKVPQKPPQKAGKSEWPKKDKNGKWRDQKGRYTKPPPEELARREAEKKAKEQAAKKAAQREALKAGAKGLAKGALRVAGPIGTAVMIHEGISYAAKNMKDYSKISPEEARNVLENGSERDIKSFGGREKLEEIAGIKKEPVQKAPLPATGAGGGRGFVNPQAVTPAPEPPSNVAVSGSGQVITSGSGQAVMTGTGLEPGKGGIGLKPPISMTGDDKPIMEMIKRHEGVRTKPYKDSLGLWTVGVGHLIGDGKTLPREWDRELSMQEVDQLFAEDYKHHKEAATKIPGYNKLNMSGQGALIDLTFNMGPTWWKKWPNFTKNISAGNTEGAASSLEDSKWYQQVKSRAKTIVAMIRQGSDQASPAMATPGTGRDIQETSTAVAAAKKDKQTGNITVVAVNNTTEIRKAASPQPRRELATNVG